MKGPVTLSTSTKSKSSTIPIKPTISTKSESSEKKTSVKLSTSKSTEIENMEELSILKAENSKLREENESKNKEIKLLKAENLKLRKETKIKNSELSRIEQENQALQNKLKEYKKQISDNAKRTTTSENENAALKKSKLDLLESREINELKIIKKIGQGSQSKVYEVTREQHYALKVLLISEESNKTGSNSNLFKALQRLLQEYEILHLLKHRNIIESIGFFYGDEKHPPSILLEYCPCNLAHKVKSMNDIERVCAIIEISLGMEAVHSSNMIHRDLKPENILIDETGHVKLSDFGIACIVDVENQTQTKTGGVGTLKFMAPEILQESVHYTNKVDVYSFGVVVFYILTGGQMPKISIGDQSLGKQASIPSKINEISRKLIKGCWSKEEKNRPSFSDIIEFIKKNKFQLIDGVESNIDEIKSFTSL